MEIIFNELSLHNQFQSFDDFRENALIDIIGFFSLPKIKILKKSDTYSRSIYQGKTLHDILISKNSDGKSEEIRKFKIILSKIINDEFWDLEKKCDKDATYLCLEKDVCESGLAESYERSTSLISLRPSDFILASLEVSKNSQPLSLENYTRVSNLLDHLYTNNVIDFQEFCKLFFKNSKLDFTNCNSSQSFSLITDRSDEIQFLNSFKMFAEASWENIMSQGGKGDNKVGFAYEKYHQQDYFSNYKTNGNVYKFRVTQKFRVFGYREGDKFYPLEFDLTHKLSD